MENLKLLTSALNLIKSVIPTNKANATMVS